ncbi:MAG: tRNA (uracil-5-)-methyltransferase [Amphiamblys sp. WSBS2006]|nr:MAG: tRNA (uracil-5-)-methyltransferase [Amphiamblys sp. WSBS2006]
MCSKETKFSIIQGNKRGNIRRLSTRVLKALNIPSADYTEEILSGASTARYTVRNVKSREEFQERLLKIKLNSRDRIVVEDDSLTPSERLSNQVTPLWRMEYPRQIEEKEKDLKEHLCEIGVSPRVVSKPVLSPRTEHYRNKTDFAIGYSEDNKVTVGFTNGLYTEGIVSVHGAADCVHIPAEAKQIAAEIERHIAEKQIRPYNRKTNDGHLKLLLVRTHTEGILCCVQINPQGMAEGELDEAERGLCGCVLHKTFKTDDGGEREVKGFFVQHSERAFNGLLPAATSPFRLLGGQESVYEELMGCRFRIKIDSFFQTNKYATEKMYETIRRLALCGEQTGKVLLDLCCGTGTIGITLADSFARVVGVDLCESSIEMARENAALAGKKNVSFHCGDVTEKIAGVLSGIEAGCEVVVVLDPPRQGVSRRVTRAIREEPRIKQVVFASCALKQSKDNIEELITPGKDAGEFCVEECTMVDMFPHTKHYEAVSLLRRK